LPCGSPFAVRGIFAPGLHHDFYPLAGHHGWVYRLQKTP
jgi:hypothetical protein